MRRPVLGHHRTGLAEAFGARLGRDVAFGQTAPVEFRSSMAPLIGESAAADIAGAYQAMSVMPGRSIPPETSARKLLGVTPPPDHQPVACPAFRHCRPLGPGQAPGPSSR